MKNKEIKIFKKNTKMLLKFTKNYKKEDFFNKNNLKIIKNTIFLEIKQDKNDEYSYCKLYYNDKLIKIIYPFYPNVSSQSKKLNKFCVDEIAFCVLPKTDALHYELIKYYSLHNIDLIIIMCDFKNNFAKSYLNYLYKTINSHFLLVNENNFNFYYNKDFCQKGCFDLNKKNNTIFYCNSCLYDLIYKKLK